MSTSTTEQASPAPRRLPPEMIIRFGCAIAILTFGPRSAVGVFQLPILKDRGWGSDVFSYAMALQYLFWGLGQPFAGAMADRFGSARVLTIGLILYGSGLALMAYARATHTDRPPFLVVAPSSVVSVWASEAAKFTREDRRAPRVFRLLRNSENRQEAGVGAGGAGAGAGGFGGSPFGYASAEQ